MADNILLSLMKKINDLKTDLEICEYRIEHTRNTVDIIYFTHMKNKLSIEYQQYCNFEQVVRHPELFAGQGSTDVTDSESQILFPNLDPYNIPPSYDSSFYLPETSDSD